MTVKQFALATGYAHTYIQSACKKGRIPCTMCNGKWEISPALVPLWAAKRCRPAQKSGKTIHNSVTVYQREVDRYNARHGTQYSYGEAVAKELIK